jgi:hypothetical protein
MTAKELTKGFAFVAADAVPKRTMDSDRLAAFREEQKAARRAAGEQVAKGLLGGKALTDNEVFTDRNEADKTAARAKALVNPILAEHGQRASVTVSGSDESGYRWFVVAKAVEADA